MGKICECTAGGNNLGQAVCDAVLQSWNKTLFKERLDANGDVPKLPFTTEVGAKDLAFWDTYLQATPFRNRYILGDGIDDFEFEHNEREAVETANAVSYKVRDGHIDVTYNVFGSKGASTKLYSKYKALECLNLGINIIDDAGQVAGPVDSADDMLLIPIDSLQVRYGAQQNSGQIAHIIVEFRIPFTFDWGSVRIFQYDKSTDVNPLDLRPIVDVNGTLAAAAGTTITATLKLESSQIGGHPLVGLGLANFSATLNGSAETLVAVTETADGVYSITTTSTLASSDVVALTLVASGFEMPVITATV